jgi:hypothetical protein
MMYLVGKGLLDNQMDRKQAYNAKKFIRGLKQPQTLTPLRGCKHTELLN